MKQDFLVSGLMAAVLTLIPWASGAAPPPEMEPIPEIQLQHLETSVQEQLTQAREALEALQGSEAIGQTEWAETYGDMAQLYHAYELYPAAEACYRNALALSPDSLEWNYSYGFLFQTTGRFEEAVPHYEKALGQAARPQIVYLLHIRLGECAFELNDPASAAVHYDAAAEILPEGASILARRGILALEEKRFEEAVTFLEKALAAQPAANRLHYSLGMAYRGLGNMEKAREHVSKRGKVGVSPPDPLKQKLAGMVNSYRVYVLKGRMAYGVGRYGDAAAEFKKAIAADPKRAGARVNLGTTYTAMKRYREAVAVFEEALDLEPENITARYNLGELYLRGGAPNRAIPFLEGVVKENPKDAEAHLLLAKALEGAARFQDAYEHFRETEKLRPDLADSWRGIARILFDSGSEAEAKRILEEARGKLPQEGGIAMDLSRLLSSCGTAEMRDGSRALALAKEAHERLGHYETVRAVAMALAELGRCDEAAQWMARAVEMAERAQVSADNLALLKRNLAHLREQRPCRIPVKE